MSGPQPGCFNSLFPNIYIEYSSALGNQVLVILGSYGRVGTVSGSQDWSFSTLISILNIHPKFLGMKTYDVTKLLL